MTDISSNPFASDGFQAEEKCVSFFDKLIEREHLRFKVIHSVVDGNTNHEQYLHTIRWIDSPKDNAQKGDIRIYRCDEHGRPVEGSVLYIDVKFSKNWPYASLSFPAKSGSAKIDAENHICSFIGDGIADRFWYMTIGTSGTYMFKLSDVKEFIKNSSEEKLLSICKNSKYNGSPAWYLSFEDMILSVNSYSLNIWINDNLLSEAR